MEILTNLFGTNLNTAIFVVLNLVLIESLLSIDNAAVLATMVMKLPDNQRGKALKYGILGAYFFRGLCLLFASLLIKIIWLKVLGGMYLLYISINYFTEKFLSNDGSNDSDDPETKSNLLDGILGTFWSTVAMVEIMDLAFSIDNVFAAVAFTDKIGLICLGVFIGIFSMRFAAQFFVKLIEKYPFLEALAFTVIFLLGLKLCASFTCDVFYKTKKICEVINGHTGDVLTSSLTLLIFLLPIAYSSLNSRGKK